MLKNGRRFFWSLGLACLGPGLAQAQFDKTPWPRTQPTPPIDMVDLSGKRWTRADLLGRTVVINFWATWCGPCKEEMPSLQALHAHYSPGPAPAHVPPVAVIGINVKETASTVRRFMTAQHLDLPVVLDLQGQLTRQWGVRIYPTTILLGPDGRAHWRVVGDLDWNGPVARGWLTDMQPRAASSAASPP